MIAIIENEFESLKSSFEISLKIVLGDVPDYKVFPASQDFELHISNCPFSFIFVDIELSTKSSQDGLEIVSALLAAGYPQNNICILTGYLDAASLIKDRKLPPLKVINKPISFKDVIPILKDIK